MPRILLDQEIDKSIAQVVRLEDMVSHAAVEAVEALLAKDTEKSKAVYLHDKVINNLRFEIENKTLPAIATQQPLAIDLRTLASVLEVVTELERMSDFAKGIARINLIIERKSTKVKSIVHLREMTGIAVRMLHQAVQHSSGLTQRLLESCPAKMTKLMSFSTKSLLAYWRI